MIYPPYAAPFPDAKAADITLGNQQRAMLTMFAQKPGKVVTPEELATGLGLPFVTPRRAETLIGGINEVLGDEAVIDVHRRGWMLRWYVDEPVTISH